MVRFVKDEGVDYLSLLCSRSGAFFLERPRQDIGIDGQIEFCDSLGEPTGSIALVQVKSGMSYVSESGEYCIRAKSQHFRRWSLYTTNPVIGVIYNPVNRDAKWVNISRYLETHAESIKDGPYVIKAPDNQTLDEDTFAVLQEEIDRIHAYSSLRSAQSLIDSYLTESGVRREECLTELFTNYRWTPLVCFFVHNAIRSESDASLVAYLTYLMSFYRPHGDRFYTRENMSPPELRDLASPFILNFGVSEIIKMLSCIDPDDGIDRGSMGQLVAIQLSAITDITSKLCAIIQDRIFDTDIRFHAIGILVEYLGFDDARFFKHLLSVEQDSSLIEAGAWALDVIIGYQTF